MRKWYVGCRDTRRRGKRAEVGLTDLVDAILGWHVRRDTGKDVCALVLGK
jgi:hypothetical protein